MSRMIDQLFWWVLIAFGAFLVLRNRWAAERVLAQNEWVHSRLRLPRVMSPRSELLYGRILLVVIGLAFVLWPILAMVFA
jgi:hypothetical protein